MVLARASVPVVEEAVQMVQVLMVKLLMEDQVVVLWNQRQEQLIQVE